MVNPDDIESISVLKDAASASIYGIKGAFGVVLITTKNAKIGERFTVSYSDNFAWKKPTVKPELAIGSEGATLALLGAERSKGVSSVTNDINMYWDWNTIDRMKEWERVYGGYNLSPELVYGRDYERLNGNLQFYRSWDPYDMMTRNSSFMQTHNFGINGSYYWNLRGDTIFSINAGAATVDSYGDHDVPIFERLYLGGPYNMRGFRFRDVAPYNPALSGDETMGGRSSFFCQFEYSIPVIEEVRVAVFYDIGFVNGDAFDFSASKIVSDYGIGLRLNLPIGPLAVDYAIPIQKNNAIDRGGQFQFYLNYSY